MKRYIVVKVPADPSRYHIEQQILETDDDQCARTLRDEMRVANIKATYEAYDRSDNKYLDTDLDPNTVIVRPYYTIYHVRPDVINDGLGHEFQVIEGRLYHSPYRSSIYVEVILNQLVVTYPQSRYEIYSVRGLDPTTDLWSDHNGASIYSESLIYHLNAIRTQLLREVTNG